MVKSVEHLRYWRLSDPPKNDNLVAKSNREIHSMRFLRVIVEINIREGKMWCFGLQKQNANEILSQNKLY